METKRLKVKDLILKSMIPLYQYVNDWEEWYNIYMLTTYMYKKV